MRPPPRWFHWGCFTMHAGFALGAVTLGSITFALVQAAAAALQLFCLREET